MKIAILGVGMVGSALKRYFEKDHELFLYDKKDLGLERGNEMEDKEFAEKAKEFENQKAQLEKQLEEQRL
jgi:3-hydroxyacyl-CoA dehydrogenase